MSKIAWTEETLNLWTGCTKVSAGCKNCYAEAMAKRFGWDARYDCSKIEMHLDRITIPERRKKPTMYFVNSMSDFFHEDIPDQVIREMLERMAACKQHVFQILTKRAFRLSHFKGLFAKNIWVGVSVEDSE